MRLIPAALLGLALTLGASAASAQPSAITVTVDGVSNGKPMPIDQALCIATADGKSAPGKNLRPAIHWSGAPKGTQSFAVFMIDPDVPADFTDAGKVGKTIAANAARQNFFHYGVIDIPASASMLNGGEAKTKPSVGIELVNDLGTYVPSPTQFGGPCPPWNDARLHHYHFWVLALGADAPKLAKTTPAKEAFKVLVAKALSRGAVFGTYTLNPAVH